MKIRLKFVSLIDYHMLKQFIISNKLRILVLSLPLLAIMKMHLFSSNNIITYSTIWLLSSLLYLIAVYFIKFNKMAVMRINFFLVLSILIQISFLNYEPIGSDDIYRYMWDGKIQSAGINPYQYKPSDEKLSFLHSNILPERMNYKEMKTIYFPLSQWIFYFGYNLSKENYWGYKVFILISILISFLLIKKILEMCALGEKNLLIFVLSPLIYFQFSIDGHLDAFGLPILLASFYFYFKNHNMLSAIFLGLSFSIKPIGIVLLPIFFIHQNLFKDKLLFVILPFVAFGFQFIPYLTSSNPFEAFIIYTKNWLYNGFVFTLINSVIHNNQIARSITSGLLVVSLLPIYFSKFSLLSKSYYAFLFMILFSPVVHAWYLSWLLVLIPFVANWSGIYLVASVSLTSFTLMNYKLNGIWKDYFIVQVVEFMPVIIIALFEIYRLKQDEINKKEKPKFNY